MSGRTREVCVLEPFKDKTGVQRSKGDVFTVAYQTDRQRQAVNEMVHRGFLTLEVEQATAYLVEKEPPKRGTRK